MFEIITIFSALLISCSSKLDNISKKNKRRRKKKKNKEEAIDEDFSNICYEENKDLDIPNFNLNSNLIENLKSHFLPSDDFIEQLLKEGNETTLLL